MAKGKYREKTGEKVGCYIRYAYVTKNSKVKYPCNINILENLEKQRLSVYSYDSSTILIHDPVLGISGLKPGVS